MLYKYYSHDLAEFQGIVQADSTYIGAKVKVVKTFCMKLTVGHAWILSFPHRYKLLTDDEKIEYL